MPPVYETDIARLRWEKSDWENYELWEQVAARHRRRQRMWVLAAIAVFLILSSVPVVLDRSPKWSTLAAARRLAQEINVVKRSAGLDHAAYRLRFVEGGSPEFQIEKAGSCSDKQATVVRTGRLFSDEDFVKYALMTTSMATDAGIPGLVREFCYDYLSGSDAIQQSASGIVGFGIVPVRDLPEGRLDRVSILTVSGPSGEPNFD